MKDYSMYKYYKGSDDFPNKKAAFFGSYERGFDHSYKGKPEDKEDAFKDFMCHLLCEQIADACMFGIPGRQTQEEQSKYLDEGFRIYFEPEYRLEYYQ